VLEGSVVRIVTHERLRAAVLVALAGLALSVISCAAPRVAAAARTGSPGQSACPASRSFSSLPLFAHVKKADDIMVDSSGNVWVSNVGGHKVTELSPAGTVVRVFADHQNPEGMVQLSASTMALANQKSNQVVVFNTKTGKSKLWVQLTSKGLGVDGIGIEPGMLLLPDAAGGNLDTVPLPPFSGAPVTVATGLGRPVDATPVGDGTLLVSVENAPGLDLVNPVTGAVSPAANFASTDDVVFRNGIAYVANNGGGTMSAITLSTGTVDTLVTGVKAAQGLAMRADGTFLVGDESSGDIRVAVGC
jgi:DNA-binding beta-propeller fold protein YncE